MRYHPFIEIEYSAILLPPPDVDTDIHIDIHIEIAPHIMMISCIDMEYNATSPLWPVITPPTRCVAVCCSVL